MPDNAAAQQPTAPAQGPNEHYHQPLNQPRALRIGVAGPVGTGKSSILATLCRELADELSMAVVTNDIYTDEDARFLRSAPSCPPSASAPSRREPAPIPRSATT